MTQSKPLPAWMNRRFPAAITTRLHLHNIFIVPSIYSFLLAMVMLVLWVMSVQFLVNLGYLLVFLLLGVLLLGMLQTFKNLSGLTIQTGDFNPVFAEETAGLIFELLNSEAHEKRGIELIITPVHASPSIQASRKPNQPLEQENNPAITVIDRIPAHGRITAVVTYVANRRGWHHIPRLSMRTMMPLGLFVAWSYFNTSKQLLVYPKPIFTPSPLNDEAQGDEMGSREVEGREEIIGLREYQAGDALNMISWKHIMQRDDGEGGGPWISKLSARSAGGKTRLFRLEQTESIAGLDYQISQLCGWILTAYQEGDAFGIALPNTMIQVGSGDSHLKKCLQALAEY